MAIHIFQTISTNAVRDVCTSVSNYGMSVTLHVNFRSTQLQRYGVTKVTADINAWEFNRRLDVEVAMNVNDHEYKAEQSDIPLTTDQRDIVNSLFAVTDKLPLSFVLKALIVGALETVVNKVHAEWAAELHKAVTTWELRGR